jgi:stage II sporulation protein D
VVDVDPATGQAFDVTSSRFRWTVTWSADSLHDTFKRTLADSLPAGVSDVGEIVGFETLEYTPSGRIRSMRITTSTATFLVGGDRIRWIFLTPAGSILNSSKFELTSVRDSAGRVQQIVAEGMGWGHGIGMCQVGAMGRARAGQDYERILEAYYPRTELLRLY